MNAALAVLGGSTVAEPTDLDVLRDAHNRQTVELWLSTYGQYTTTRVRLDDEVKGVNPNKPGSRENQNLSWLEALTDPEVLASPLPHRPARVSHAADPEPGLRYCARPGVPRRSRRRLAARPLEEPEFVR